MQNGLLKLKTSIETEREVEFWGGKYVGHDVFIEKSQGDGRKLLCITTLSDRPWSYFIRVDSSFNEKNERDIVYEALDLIEEEFCSIETIHYLNDNLEEDEEPCSINFPVLDTNSGYSWSVVRWRDFTSNNALEHEKLSA